MNFPGFTAETSVYATLNLYRTSGGVYEPAIASVLPQRLGYTCVGQYCDCKGVGDCIDMINHKCGGWTRCIKDKSGALRCLCEPRMIA